MLVFNNNKLTFVLRGLHKNDHTRITRITIKNTDKNYNKILTKTTHNELFHQKSTANSVKSKFKKISFHFTFKNSGGL